MLEFTTSLCRIEHSLCYSIHGTVYFGLPICGFPWETLVTTCGAIGTWSIQLQVDRPQASGQLGSETWYVVSLRPRFDWQMSLTWTKRRICSLVILTAFMCFVLFLLWLIEAEWHIYASVILPLLGQIMAWPRPWTMVEYCQLGP